MDLPHDSWGDPMGTIGRVKGQPLVAILAAVTLTMVGCSDRGLPDHQLSNPTVLKPGQTDSGPPIKQPETTFELPKSPVRVKDKIAVVVNLEIPENSKIPEAVVVAFFKGDVEAGSTTATIQQRGSERSFKLGAAVPTPQLPGKYALRATFIYNTFVEEAGKTSPPKTTYLKSQDVEVEVSP